jgi:hypothetical protein
MGKLKGELFIWRDQDSEGEGKCLRMVVTVNTQRESSQLEWPGVMSATNDVVALSRRAISKGPG